MQSLWFSVYGRVLILVTTLALLFSACAPIAPPPAPLAPDPASITPAITPAITVTDALGRTVTLPRPPERVALTGRGLFMIADAIYLFPEAGSRIVGMGQTNQGSSNFVELIDPDYAQKAALEREAGAEQIAALQPDLVLMKSALAESLGQPIEAIGLPVVYVDFETPAQYARDLDILGQIFQNPARAQEVAGIYAEKAAQIQNAVAGAALPRTLLLYYNDRDGVVAFNVPPLNWIQTEMVQMAGGDPVWADANLGGGWTQVTLEQIAAWDADQIFVVSYLKDSAQVVAGLLADPNWQALRAAQAGALHAFPGDLYSWDQPDVRWILGLTWLAGRLHPDRFPDLDIFSEVESFYATFYGLDAAFVEQNIRPTFQGDLP